MPTIDLVARLIADQYGVQPSAIADLQNYVFDWRGTYRVDQADGTAWVVRVINRAEAANEFAGTARLLDWLHAQNYPAPRAVGTINGARVGQAEGWWMLAITFVPGRIPEPTPEHLRAMGAALGRLHRLALPSAHDAAELPDSIWPPGTVGMLHRQLERSASRWPAELRAIYERLIATFDRLAEVEALPTCLIHGDCWPLNTVLTPTGELVLIDWDGAGYGPAVLDLGKLLLAAHYDLSRPLEVFPNPAWVTAILQGYTAIRPLATQERRLLPAALPFWLAFSAADYTQGTEVLTPDDLFFQKLRVRLAAAEAIADLVREVWINMRSSRASIAANRITRGRAAVAPYTILRELNMIEQARTPRQQHMIDLAGTLADRFAARADTNDRAGRFPIENYRELHEAGFLRLIVPPEYGGDGVDLYETVLFQERLAQGDGATAMAANMTMHLIGRLHERCTWPEPIFAAICRDIVASGALINAAASEPELGSPSRGGVPATTATPTDGGYLINGHKQYVSMAPALRFFVTSAALPPGPDAPQGATANAIVRAGSEGLRLEDTWGDALALRASGSYDVVYQDVFVPEEWLVERQPVGQAPPAGPPSGMAWFALTMAAVYLGIGQAASDAICRYAQQRVPSALGKPIATLPAIQRRIGEAQAALIAARGVLHQTARDWVAQPEWRAGMAPQIALAKYLCTNAAVAATDHALRVAGGFGLTRQLPLERFYRDVRAGLTHPPHDDAALEMIGRAALDAAQ